MSSLIFEITTWVLVMPCTFMLLSNIYRDEDWHDNDGALNTVSMLYPRVPTAHPNCHLGPDFKDGQSLQTGIWYVLSIFWYLQVLFVIIVSKLENLYFDVLSVQRYHTLIEGDHISFIINRERAGIQFDLLYTSIFHRCRKQMRRSVSTPILQEIS